MFRSQIHQGIQSILLGRIAQVSIGLSLQSRTQPAKFQSLRSEKTVRNTTTDTQLFKLNITTVELQPSMELGVKNITMCIEIKIL